MSRGESSAFERCSAISRREWLVRGGAGALATAGLFPAAARGAPDPSAPKAKRVILLWLWGGVPHLDTFDPKGDCPLEYRGPFRPIAAATPGVRLSELLPRLARRSERFAILRSLFHDSNDHGIAGTIGLTSAKSGAKSLGGESLPGALRPSLGSIVSRLGPIESGVDDRLPRFVALGGRLHQGHRPIAGEGGGVLGVAHDPFRLDYDPTSGVRVPDLRIQEGLSAEQLNQRLRLRDSINLLGRRSDDSPGEAELRHYYERALALLTASGVGQVFELEREAEKTRRRYGMFRFGQCCLLARRLIESGVGFVQVNWSSHVEGIEDAGDGGWDAHDRNFQVLQDRYAWMLDQAMSALLDDLSERGLLDDTLILALGEFGRSPKINSRAGRDHWELCYSGVVAGGGVRGGQVLGASDRRGEFPTDLPVTPGDLAMTALAQLGIGTTDLTDLGLTPPGVTIEGLA